MTTLMKAEAYRELDTQLAALYAGERNALANAANLAALLYHSLDDVNWAGFYWCDADGLVLGPFQGKVACVRIALGAGVCGAAAERRATVIVEDVHEFPGHIACDAASRAEIVVPLLRQGQLLGVLDLDSPATKRFDRDDGIGLQMLAERFMTSSDLDHWALTSTGRSL